MTLRHSLKFTAVFTKINTQNSVNLAEYPVNIAIQKNMAHRKGGSKTEKAGLKAAFCAALNPLLSDFSALSVGYTLFR